MPDSLRDGLIINEILPQPIAGSGGYDTDGNGTAHANDEYIEFYNSSDAPIDISGIELWDPGWGRWFIFPEGSILPPDGYAILITNIQAGGSLPDADLSFAAGRSALINNSGGDHILLRDPLANEYIVASYDNPPPLDTNAIPGFPADQTQVGDGENFGAMIPGSSIQRVPNGGDSFENNLEPTPGAVNLCFVSGTLIMTPQGPRPIEVLRVGDEIMTAHGSRAPIRWLGARRITLIEAAANPTLWPVTFERGSLGKDLPQRQLQLSPHHRVLVDSAVAERVFGAREVLVAAKDFLAMPGVSQARPERDFWYLHIMCDRHDLILANGVVAETLYLGEMTKAALSDKALAEVLAIFPDLADTSAPEPACLFGQGKRARKLVQRHVQNEKPIQSSRR